MARSAPMLIEFSSARSGQNCEWPPTASSFWLQNRKHRLFYPARPSARPPEKWPARSMDSARSI